MNERGVAPIISTILMVAVVVILAAVVSVFVLGLGEDIEKNGPTASFDYDWDKSERTLTIAHAAGEVFRAGNTDRLEVVIWDDDETGGNDFDVARADWANPSGGFPVDAGDRFTITGEHGGGDLDVEVLGTDVSNPGTETHEPEIDDEVRIIWHGEGTSYVVSKYVITSGEDP